MITLRDRALIFHFDEYETTPSVRTFLKAKGLSDTEIEARLATGDPLEAVKPFLANDRDSRQLIKLTATPCSAHSCKTAGVT